MNFGKVITVIILGALLLLITACIDNNKETSENHVTPTVAVTQTPTITGTPSPTVIHTVTPKPIETAVPTPTVSPTLTPTLDRCGQDELDIQAALDSYYAEFGKWPTADGQPGEIIWEEIVPIYMDEMPYSNNKCEWKVSSNPEGDVCHTRFC